MEHIINFDFPWNTSDYLHRAGRVGRAGSARAGTVTSFVSRPLDIEMAQRIEVRRWTVPLARRDLLPCMTRRGLLH